jgi:hypothetical protein
VALDNQNCVARRRRRVPPPSTQTRNVWIHSGTGARLASSCKFESTPQDCRRVGETFTRGHTIVARWQHVTGRFDPEEAVFILHIIWLTWSRTRRVLRPVNGNNKTGCKGKLICLACRKIRSKVSAPALKFLKAQCVYSSEEDPCQFCTGRNLICIKSWGPKNRLSPVPSGPKEVSLINDSNLSDTELSSLRYLLHWHNHSGGYWGTGWLTVALQHLWGRFGFTFAGNNALLYSLVAFGHYHMHQCKKDNNFLSYISRFQRSLIVAIGKNDISDSHLFAIFFALEMTHDRHHRMVHQRGFMKVLQELITTRGLDKHDNAVLADLYPFILSYVRRMDHYYNFHDRSPEKIQLRYEMHCLAQVIPFPSSVVDPRTAVGFPLRFWQNKQAPISWDVLEYSLWDDLASLMACFQEVFCVEASVQQMEVKTLSAMTSIQSIVRSFEDLVRLPQVARPLNCVYSRLKFAP